MNQPTFADMDYQSKERKTRREVFLERMDGLIPWERLEKRIRPVYPKAGKGRRPYPLPVMLRIHCVQLFYNLSDPGMEDLLYEAESVRRFAGLRLSDPLPDETTTLNFRHLLARTNWGKACLRRSTLTWCQARDVTGWPATQSPPTFRSSRCGCSCWTGRPDFGTYPYNVRSTDLTVV